MRYLGLDLGRARIGLALADDVLRTARPLSVVRHRSREADLAAIVEILQEWEVGTAVVGLPLNMDGTEGPAARYARAFAAELARVAGLPVELFDERLSTFEAESRLRDQGFSAKDLRARRRRGGGGDLQGWLDRRRVKRFVLAVVLLALLAVGAAAASPGATSPCSATRPTAVRRRGSWWCHRSEARAVIRRCAGGVLPTSRPPGAISGS
jgi:putative Holliday junction resolvase